MGIHCCRAAESRRRAGKGAGPPRDAGGREQMEMGGCEREDVSREGRQSMSSSPLAALHDELRHRTTPMGNGFAQTLCMHRG